MTGRGALQLLVALLTMVASLFGIVWVFRTPPKVRATTSVTQLLGGDAKGFTLPEKPRAFIFPEDHRPHSGFRSEWWYFTGNLQAPQGDAGYQLTFFRQALQSPLEKLTETPSAWAANHAWMAHFAIADLKGPGAYHDHQKFSREALGLAGSSLNPDKLWLDDWSIQWSSTRSLRLIAKADFGSLDLNLQSEKPTVLQGNRGLSSKGPERGQTSFYYSFTRIRTEGSLRLAGQQPRVCQGLSWMDREWSSRSLGQDLAGWDWFALQFDDGQELMYYQLRRRDGTPTAFSSGTWVDTLGEYRHLNSKQVKLAVTSEWDSPRGSARYPAGWRLQLHNGDTILVSPRLADQELDGLTRYWEGAVQAECLKADGRRIAGKGYVELVGYARNTGKENGKKFSR